MTERLRNNRFFGPLVPAGFVIVASFVVLPYTSKGEKAPSKAWLAFGDLRGYIEPCGCDPATDKGGVLRIANFVEESRQEYRDLLLFNLGNNFSVPLSDHSIKNKYIARGLSQIKPTASLVNEIEWLQIDALNSKLKYVLSNSKANSDKFSESIVDGDSIVFGYLWKTEFSESLEKYGPKLRAKWEALTKRKDQTQKMAQRLILLYSGPDEHLEAIAKSGFFSQIVSSNNSSLNTVIDDIESRKPGRLLRLSKPMEIYQVPIGGQGVLRGGGLRSKSKPEILNQLVGITRKKDSHTLGEKLIFYSN